MSSSSAVGTTDLFALPIWPNIEARQSLPARLVRAGSMGRACESEAEQVGGPRAQVLDRGRQEAAASGDRKGWSLVTKVALGG